MSWVQPRPPLGVGLLVVAALEFCVRRLAWVVVGQVELTANELGGNRPAKEPALGIVATDFCKEPADAFRFDAFRGNRNAQQFAE